MAVVGTVTLLVGLACLLPAMIRPTCALLADGIYREKVNENEPVVVVTDMLFLDQDTFLYSEQYGKVYICQRANGDLNKQLYVDLESVTHGGGNKGILDMLLDDDFENSKQVWFYYSRNEVPGPAGAAAMTHRVSRFTHIDNQGGLTQRLDPNSEVPVWVDPEGYPDLPLALHWHYGSQLVWGPGGMLYFAQGDKMINPDWASDINYFAGCLIRMNKDGTFPADNDGVQAGGAPGCWGADGLRSPWRVHYDEPTNRFIIGDVGGNDQVSVVACVCVCVCVGGCGCVCVGVWVGVDVWVCGCGCICLSVSLYLCLCVLCVCVLLCPISHAIPRRLTWGLLLPGHSCGGNPHLPR